MSSPASAHRGRRVALLLMTAAGLWLAVTLGRLALPQSGLRAQYFPTTDWSGDAAVERLDPAVTTPQLSQAWRYAPPDAFSAQWSGHLFVDAPGEYVFALDADDSARLYVNQRLVSEGHVGGGGSRGAIELTRGTHPILLQYANLGGPYTLEWSWSRSRAPFERVPGWRLSPRPRGAASVLARRVAGWLSTALALTVLGLGLVAFRASRCWPVRSDAPPSAGRIAPRQALGALAFFTALAILHTWPLATDPGGLSRHDNADALLNEWTLAWVAHQMVRNPGQLFDANIFFPDRNTLAYSEALLTQSAFAAPILWLGGTPLLAYNLTLLAGMVLSGWSLWLVVSRWTGDRVAGLVAGTLGAINAHTLSRLPHVQAQHVEFLPLALLALDALLRRPRWSAAVWLAVWFSLQSLASGYLLVLGIAALGVAVLARPEDWLPRERLRRLLPALAVAALAASILLLPFLLPYQQARSAQGLVRSLDEVAYFSASWRDYLTTPARIADWIGFSQHGSTALFPGLAGLLLAAVAILSGTAVRDARARMCLAFGLAGVALSFGPVVPGYAELYTLLPVLQGVRGAARFGFLAIIAIAVLAGFGTAALRQRLPAHARMTPAIAGVALVVLVAMEPLAAPLGFSTFPGIPAIYQRPAASPGAVVVELPFPPPDAFYRNAPYVLNSTAHWRPLLNGYSGFVPPTYYRHYAALGRFPEPSAIDALRTAGVTHAFVHRDRMPAELAAAVDRTPGLRRLASEGEITLYEVVGRAAHDTAAAGGR